jgi:hypothetical protein
MAICVKYNLYNQAIYFDSFDTIIDYDKVVK